MMMIMMVKKKARKHIKKMKNDENVKKITKNLHIIMQINQIRMKQDFFFVFFLPLRIDFNRSFTFFVCFHNIIVNQRLIVLICHTLFG